MLSEDPESDIFEVLDDCNRKMYIQRAEGYEGFVWQQLDEEDLP